MGAPAHSHERSPLALPKLFQPPAPLGRHRIGPANRFLTEDPSSLDELGCLGLVALHSRERAPKREELGVAVDPEGIREELGRALGFEALKQQPKRSQQLGLGVGETIFDERDVHRRIAPEELRDQRRDLFEPAEDEVPLHWGSVD
jgi:hypothetical protein